MNPFRYPESRHHRARTPGPFTDYRRYKPHLQAEFARQCVYCRMPEGPKGEDSFGVDHYRPVSQFPDLRSDYGNLFYSCNLCNSWKSDFWPTAAQQSRGEFLPNPCDHVMSEHLRYHGARVEATSPAGELAITLLMLNDDEAVGYREFLLRSIERCLSQAAATSEFLLTLGPRLNQTEGAAREALQQEISKHKSELADVAHDYERLTGMTLPRLG